MSKIDEYSDISQDDLDRLEARRKKMEVEKVAERQTLKAALMCSDVIDEVFKLTDKMIKEDVLEFKDQRATTTNKVATLAVKLQQIHMMRSGLLPPVSTNKETQEKWENQAINQYEAEAKKRAEARGRPS